MGCMKRKCFWMEKRQRHFSLTLEEYRLQVIRLLQVSVSAHQESSLHTLVSPSFAIKKLLQQGGILQDKAEIVNMLAHPEQWFIILKEMKYLALVTYPWDSFSTGQDLRVKSSPRLFSDSEELHIWLQFSKLQLQSFRGFQDPLLLRHTAGERTSHFSLHFPLRAYISPCSHLLTGSILLFSSHGTDKNKGVAF